MCLILKDFLYNQLIVSEVQLSSYGLILKGFLDHRGWGEISSRMCPVSSDQVQTRSTHFVPFAKSQSAGWYGRTQNRGPIRSGGFLIVTMKFRW
jgi:hypothetical protein